MEDPRLSWLQARVLFTQDEAGRLLAVNEREPEDQPLLHAAVDADGISVWSHASLPHEVESAALDLLTCHGWAMDMEVTPGHPLAQQLRALMRQAADDRLGTATVTGGPCFVADPELDIAYPDVDGLDILLDRKEADVLISTHPYTHAVFDSRVPVAVVIRDGRVASACFSARTTLEGAEAGVDTDPRYRRQGLASAVVTAWIAAQQDFGVRPFYSTWWGNQASRRLAEGLGLRHHSSTLGVSLPV